MATFAVIVMLASTSACLLRAEGVGLSQSLCSRDLSVRWRSLRVEPCSNPIPEIKGPAPLRRTGPLMAEGVGLSQSLCSRDLSVRWRSLRVEPCSNPIPEIKGPAPLRRTGPLMAEGVGFEPTRPCGLLVFKTSAFNHSATPPGFSRMEFRRAGP